MKAIGVDIGGTKTAIGIIDYQTGKISKKLIFPSKSFIKDSKNLNFIIEKTLVLSNANRINHIGIGVPELINNKGVIKGNYNFNWSNINLAKYFPKNIKVLVDSDVRCHLRAEKYFGVARNYKNFAYINIGTGLSYAQFKENDIYSGANGYAIHFASSKISLYDWKKNKKISLIPEDYYSGKELVKILNIKNTQKKNRIMKNVADSLATIIGSLINTIDPAKIVLGGGVVIHNAYFTKILISNIRKYILADEVKKINIVTSKLKDNTGLLGAGLLFK
ncbi:ROK family protein [Alphaproteobacteria bacterium]|nr:ROK family protein [Alphaproteobacteria bacterium]MDC3270207.1 ROK family protein [Alphaproteobacteria bacterium]